MAAILKQFKKIQAFFISLIVSISGFLLMHYFGVPAGPVEEVIIISCKAISIICATLSLSAILCYCVIRVLEHHCRHIINDD